MKCKYSVYKLCLAGPNIYCILAETTIALGLKTTLMKKKKKKFFKPAFTQTTLFNYQFYCMLFNETFAFVSLHYNPIDQEFFLNIRDKNKEDLPIQVTYDQVIFLYNELKLKIQ